METQTKPGSAIPEHIGSAPLIRLDRIVQAVREFEGITLLANAEWANTGSSVKDRAASSMAWDEASASRQAVIVTILPDGPDKDLFERFWDEA